MSDTEFLTKSSPRLHSKQMLCRTDTQWPLLCDIWMIETHVKGTVCLLLYGKEILLVELCLTRMCHINP